MRGNERIHFLSGPAGVTLAWYSSRFAVRLGYVYRFSPLVTSPMAAELR